MKKLLLVIVVLLLFAVRASATTVEVSKINDRSGLADSTRQDTMNAYLKTISEKGVSDDVLVDSCEVNPYSYTEKHYTGVKGIEIYNASKGIRVVFSKTQITPSGNQYWVIPSTALGYEKDNLNFDDLYVYLKEDGGSDTPTVFLNLWK